MRRAHRLRGCGRRSVRRPGHPDRGGHELTEAASTTLEFAGTELHWYESETADAPLFVGNSFTTDVLTETTTFWVEDVLNHGLETAIGGSTAQSDGQYHNNSNYWLRFDAYQDLVIESVKVFANGETAPSPPSMRPATSSTKSP